MKFAIYPLLTFIALFATGDSLECYECFGNNSTECYHLTSKTNLKPVDCRNSTYIIGNHEDMIYQCVAYFEHYARTNDTSVCGRHCIVKTDEEFCRRYRTRRQFNDFIVDKCAICTENGCNSGEMAKITVSALFSVFILSWKLS